MYLTIPFGLRPFISGLCWFSPSGHLLGVSNWAVTFFFLNRIVEFTLSLSPQTLVVQTVQETLLPAAKSKLTVFPKGKHQKNHLSLHPPPYQGFLLTDWACPWGSLEIDNSGRINGELHFWWMNHSKILWHSSHDLFWRQINSLPKVAFYFMFKKT